MSVELDSALDLLFGNDPLCLEDSKGWIKQGFMFYDHISFGLSQHFGGPCGVLAAVQAFILLELLHLPNLTVDVTANVPFTVSDAQRTSALTRALAHIICRSTNSGNFVLVLGNVESYPVMESVGRYTSEEELVSAIEVNLKYFKSDIGVLLFVLSLILTRGVEQVQQDRDDLSQPLVQRFGHSSQDLVNLCLFGKAVSNVHDGDKVFGADSGVHDDSNYFLKGITSEVPVGFLSSLEVLRYSKVGFYYKNPVNPIWVIGSASHYSTLFGLDPNILKMSALEKLEMNVREIFNRFDHQEMGFVPMDKLSELISSLSITDSAKASAFRDQVDPDGMGIILWSNLWKAYCSIENSQMSSRSSTANWSCTACTFSNLSVLDYCEICSSKKPVHLSTPSEQKSEEPASPRNFNLWHFNGISNSLVDPARCIRVMISLSDLDSSLLQQGQVDEAGLREVIQTRWENAAVDYADSRAPKIT